MSDSSDDDNREPIYTPVEAQLRDAHNFTYWRGKLRVKLERLDYLHYIKAPRIDPEYSTPLEHPTPESPMTTVAQQRYDQDRKVTAYVIHYSLSADVQFSVPESLFHVDKHVYDPKGMYEHLVDMYGQLHIHDQSMLWRELFTRQIPEGADPRPQLCRINQIVNILQGSYAQRPEMTVRELLENVGKFALLESLPDSYDPLRNDYLLGKLSTVEVPRYQLATRIEACHRFMVEERPVKPGRQRQRSTGIGSGRRK